MAFMPKKQYKRLPKAAKKAVKASIVGRGAYKMKTMPLLRSVKGRGAYIPDKYSNKDLAQTIGGRAVGYLWDKIFGNGAYAPTNFTVKSNKFMNEIVANGPPQVWSTKQQEFVLRHREYLGDVITGATARDFNLNSYYINPGSSRTFPWGSNIANNFQQYKIEGMLFEFISTCSDAIASSTDLSLGTVIMATNYNVNDDDFASKQQMLQTEFCSQGKPSQCILHPIECKPALSSIDVLYVHGGAPPPGEDERLYDLGKFQIATQGFQGTSINIGELWVTYEIKLLKPIQTNGANLLIGDMYEGFAGIATNALVGVSPTLVSGSTDFTTVAENYVQFDIVRPNDVYLVIYTCSGSSATVSSPTMSPSGCTLLQLWQHGYGTSAFGPQNGLASTTRTCCAALVKIDADYDGNPASAPYLSISYSTLPASPTSSEMLICRVNPNLPLTFA